MVGRLVGSWVWTIERPALHVDKISVCSEIAKASSTSMLADPAGMLEGKVKYMRYVKLNPTAAADKSSCEAPISAAYQDIVARLRAPG